MKKIIFDWSNILLYRELWIRYAIEDQEIDFIIPSNVIINYIMDLNGDLRNSCWQKSVNKKIKYLLHSQKEFQDVFYQKASEERLKNVNFKNNKRLLVSMEDNLLKEGLNIFNDYRKMATF